VRVHVGVTPDGVIILRGSSTDESGPLRGEVIRQVPIGSRCYGIPYDGWMRFVNQVVDLEQLQGGGGPMFDVSERTVR
jgi:hypothetical protein